MRSMTGTAEIDLKRRQLNAGDSGAELGGNEEGNAATPAADIQHIAAVQGRGPDELVGQSYSVPVGCALCDLATGIVVAAQFNVTVVQEEQRLADLGGFKGPG